MLNNAENGSSGKPLAFLDIALTCGVAAAIALLGFFSLYVAAALHPDGPENSPSIQIAVFLLLEPVAIFGAVLGVLIYRRGFSWTDLGVRPIDGKWVLPAILAAFGGLFAAGAISQITERYFNTPMMDQYMSELVPGGITWQRAVALIATIGILVPIAEELLFRGVLYTWLRQRLTILPCVLISAALFALAHGNRQMVIQIFIVGIVLALIYEKSRSILVSGLVHMTVNTFSLAVIFYYAGAAPGVAAP
ncbi:MAG: type II CAAX endopeptidase family protein [Alphaproteobacteria bacterium]